MPPRSKSVPPRRNSEGNDGALHDDPDMEINLEPADIPEQQKPKKKKKSSVRRRKTSQSGKPVHVAERPEWNNDTHIEGYDDLDENGKVKRRGDVLSLKGNSAKQYQEEINRMWEESLRK